MAKRKRLTPARMTETTAPEAKSALSRPALSSRPPIADVAHDAAANAALTEVVQEFATARIEGRLIQRLPLDQVDPHFLVRDRVVMDADDLDHLASSIKERGQQTPVEVSELGGGKYGLISGFRRYAAVRQIAEKDPLVDTIMAVIRPPQDAPLAYQAMVEENEVRVDLSFYERGRIVARAKDAGVFRTDALALAALFAHVPRARRSKIGSFVSVVRALDDILKFPAALTEKLGLALAKELAADGGFAARLADLLRAKEPKSAEAEIALLAKALQGPQASARKTQGDAESLDIAQGFRMTQRASGKIELTGARMQDPMFVARLIETLKALK